MRINSPIGQYSASKILTYAIIAASLCLITNPASAQQSRKNLSRKVAVPAVQLANLPTVPTPKTNKRELSETSAEPLLGVVSLSQQRIAIWQGNRIVAEAPISSGQEGHRTPKGVFSVIQKNRYHESNIYSGAPMPFMQRLTWSGIAMHAGNLPGYPASHGCVRLPESFASNLFGMTKMGMRVIIADRQAAPVAIAHANLPTPMQRPAPGSTPPNASPEVATTGPSTAASLTPASLSNSLFVSAAHASPDAPRLLNPIEYARLEQKQIANQLADAVENANRHNDLAVLASAAHRQSLDDVRRLTADLKRDVAAVDAARQRLAAARDDEERSQIGANLHMAEEVAAETRAEIDHARTYEAETADEAMQTALATKAAFAERDAAEHRARVAVRATEPVSVFVSRKTRRVYVRQGFEPLLEAAIDFTDENTAIGTHVFTATAPVDAGRAMSWVVVTVPETGKEEGATQSAAEAIARVTLPTEVRDFVVGKLWTGASLIVSDHAPSHETGKGTDFVVITQ
ncbi:MAG: L,D-transpeptidase family protein [Hyphomicrobiaceae bacterium]|nr:L,D-transpeptidase family protein [Hyphomicrobiaceae bacterium]